MEAKPVIAIDIDDVLAANAAGFIEWSNRKFGTHLAVEDYQEHWAEVWQVDREEANRRAEEFHESDHPSTYGVIPDARQALEELKERFTLVLLTSRRSTFVKLTQDWIEKFYPNIFTDCIFCGFYDNGHTSGLQLTKATLAKELKADYLIDDQLKHIEAAAGVGIKGLLFGNYSWNKKDTLPENVKRVSDWQEVIKYFSSEGKTS